MGEAIYLEKFILPSEEEDLAILRKRMRENDPTYGGYIDSIYPSLLFSRKGLQELDFERVTIIYGGNGSGKSTLLNVIAEKLKLRRMSPYNGSELFPYYVEGCKAVPAADNNGSPLALPGGSRIITSDDVFDYMLAARVNNREVRETAEDVKMKYWDILDSRNNIRFTGMEDYEAFRAQVIARKKNVTRRKFVREMAGQEAGLRSNGETALKFFASHLEGGALYCLDEPENSLSPRLQLELAELLEDAVRDGAQLILSTHSPFLLALRGAKIYDLDEMPVTVKNWWELENVQSYYRFFKKYKEYFDA